MLSKTLKLRKKKVNYDDSKYHFKNKNIREKDFDEFDDASSLFIKISDDDMMQKKQRR